MTQKAWGSVVIYTGMHDGISIVMQILAIILSTLNSVLIPSDRQISKKSIYKMSFFILNRISEVAETVSYHFEFVLNEAEPALFKY